MKNNRAEAISISVRCIVVTLIIVLLAALPFSGCSIIKEGIAEVIAPAPNPEEVLLSTVEINEKVEEALKNGETEIELDVVATRDEIKTITANLPTFWGLPKKFKILDEYEDIEIKTDDGTQFFDVNHVFFTLEQSIDFYLYNDYKYPDYEIPSDQIEAIEISKILPSVINEIFPDGAEAMPDNYSKVLAVHQWIMNNLEYDDTVDLMGKENGIYGALINNSTMCLGYSEALMLILLCATDVDVKMVVGDANDGSGEWVGHAWNLVYMDDYWYHVDSTFSDPVTDLPNSINHFYFGQSDEIMQTDHSWNQKFWPAAGGFDFLYYRKSKLMANSLDEMKSIINAKIKNSKPKSIEVATQGFKIKDSDLKFIYNSNNGISSIYRSFMTIGDTKILQLFIEY